MKKTIYFIAAALVALMASSCQKEGAFDQNLVPTGRVITLNVNDAITKTAYTPGVGVALTGTEPIGLFYRKVEEGTTGRWCGMAATGQAKPILASPTDGAYSFTIPQGADYTEWTGIMPYSSITLFTDSNGVQMGVKLSPVQNPGANTFDPAFDYLLARNFTIDEGQNTAQITEFKRIFTPLCLKITGLDADEEIYAATFKVNQTPGVDEGEWPVLVGQFNVNCSGNINYAGIVSAEYQKDGSGAATGNHAVGNAVSAVYSDGLKAISGVWPVWYMVNPSFYFNEEATITVTVNTADACYTRTITIPEQTTLSTTRLNAITVNIKGEGYTKSEQTVLTQVFTSVTQLADAKASDGKKYAWPGAALWAVTDANKDNGSLLGNALNLTNHSATIPAISGYEIKKIRLFAHINTNMKYGTDSKLTLTYGEGQSQEYKFNFCSTDATATPVKSLTTEGGFIDIECPEGVDNLARCGLVGSGNTLMTAVAFFVEKEKEVEIEEASGDDLWAEFNAGKKITINGVAYTKKDYPSATLVDVTASGSTIGSLSGLHFIEGEYTTGGASNHISLANEVIFIGRYKDSKPSLTAGQFKMKKSAVFHNIKFTGLNSNNAFPNNNNPADNISLVLDNCDITCTGGLIRDVNATYCYETVVINACNISYKANSIYFVKDKVAVSNTNKLFSLTNSTITYTSTDTATDAMYVHSFEQPTMDVVVRGNTFSLKCTTMFNIKNNAVKSFTYADNSGFSGTVGLE